MLSCGQVLRPLGPKCLTKVKATRAFGTRFDCPGFNGRVLLAPGVLTDLCAQFSYSPRLSSLRVPAFN